jgi:hypothetical protein
VPLASRNRLARESGLGAFISTNRVAEMRHLAAPGLHIVLYRVVFYFAYSLFSIASRQFLSGCEVMPSPTTG